MLTIRFNECSSQTGCSFDGNFANFRRNIGILVDSLRRASCLVHLVPQWQELVEIFQTVLSVTSIFWRQVCEFLRMSRWATSVYQYRLDCVKKAEPVTFLQSFDNQQIVSSYKDLSSQTFINIVRSYSLHVSVAFRNASHCGIRHLPTSLFEGKSLFERESIWEKKSSDSKEASAESMSTKQSKSLLSSFASTV